MLMIIIENSIGLFEQTNKQNVFTVWKHIHVHYCKHIIVFTNEGMSQNYFDL